MQRKIFTGFSLAASTIFCVLFVINKSAASDAAFNGMILASTVVIPAVFPFLAAANFICELTLNIKSRALNFFARILFKLPGVALIPIFTGFLAGYPEGVRGAAHLYEGGKISQKQAEVITMFAVCAGPAFIIKAVGYGMLGSFHAGVLLFAAHILSALILAIILPRIFLRDTCKHKNEAVSSNQSNVPAKRQNLTDLFCESVANASRAMLVIVGFIAIFSVIIALIQTYSSGAIYNAAPMILEVTTGTQFAAENNPSLPLISAIMAFSSLSVIFQLLTFGRKIKINPLKFIGARLSHAALAAVIIIPLERLFPITAPVWSAGPHGAIHLPSVPIPAAIALVLMGVTLLISFKIKKTPLEN